MKLLFELATYICYFFLFLAVLWGLKGRKLLRREEWGYFAFIMFIALIEATNNFYISVLKSRNTFWVYEIYVVVGFPIIYFLYVRKLKLSPIWHIAGWGLLIFYFIQKWTLNINLDILKAYSNLLLSCLIGVSLLLKIKYNDKTDPFLRSDILMFFYYVVSIFLFITTGQLANIDIVYNYILWCFNNLLTAFLYYSLTKSFSQLKSLH